MSYWESIFGPKNVDFIEEPDDVARDADFTLFYRPLESAGTWTAQPFAHWAVVVEYKSEPKKVFTFEAGKQDNGSLVEATRSSEYPEDRSKWKSKRLGTKWISPQQLVRYARSVSLNGRTYDAVFNNCQAWCKEFCAKISEDFVKEQFWDAGNVLWTTSALVVGISLVAAIVHWALGGRAQNRNGKK